VVGGVVVGGVVVGGVVVAGVVVGGVVVAGVVVGVVVGQPIATRLRANNNANGINNNFFFNSLTPLLDFYSSTSLIFYHHLPYFLGCSSIFCAPPLAAMALHPDFEPWRDKSDHPAFRRCRQPIP